MERKILIRYLILIGVLVICAAAAWMLTSSAEVHEDAVLAWEMQEEEKDVLTERMADL